MRGVVAKKIALVFENLNTGAVHNALNGDLGAIELNFSLGMKFTFGYIAMKGRFEDGEWYSRFFLWPGFPLKLPFEKVKARVIGEALAEFFEALYLENIEDFRKIKDSVFFGFSEMMSSLESMDAGITVD